MTRQLAAACVLAAGVAVAGCASGTPTAPGPVRTLTIPAASTSAPPPRSAAPKPCSGGCSPTARKGHTVTYIVTGGPADVTYGPAGDTSVNTSPLHVTRPLRHPAFYTVTAQMQGPGAVACQIRVDGHAIATGSASGRHSTAQCKITRDPFTGAWTDARDEPALAG